MARSSGGASSFGASSSLFLLRTAKPVTAVTRRLLLALRPVGGSRLQHCGARRVARRARRARCHGLHGPQVVGIHSSSCLAACCTAQPTRARPPNARTRRSSACRGEARQLVFDRLDAHLLHAHAEAHAPLVLLAVDVV
jgi:hypothetical protein